MVELDPKYDGWPQWLITAQLKLDKMSEYEVWKYAQENPSTWKHRMGEPTTRGFHDCDDQGFEGEVCCNHKGGTYFYRWINDLDYKYLQPCDYKYIGESK